MSFLGILGGILGAGSAIASTAMGAVGSAKQNKIDQMNFGLQKEAFDWQKSAQYTTWAREDSAVRRRMADLKAAGINPILAAGQSAASSAPVKLGAPQREYHGADRAIAGMQTAMSLMQQKAEIGRTAAQTKLLQTQKDQEEIKNNFMTRSNPLSLQSQRMEVLYDRNTLRTNIQRVRQEFRMGNVRIKQEKLDNLLKTFNIQGAEIENNLKHIKQVIGEEGLKYIKDTAQLEYLAKKYAVAQAMLKLKTGEYNLERFQELGLPSGQSLGKFLQYGLVGRSAMRGIYDKLIE